MTLEIQIFNDTHYTPIPRRKIRRVIESILHREQLRGKPINTASVRVVVVDDATIHKLNREFLQHDYPTDILTFSLEEEQLDAEIYISIETAKRQAREYGVSLTNELMRLAAHGTLHALGYDDATHEERQIMQHLEEHYIHL
ncbi:MAG: rRNA maturation RNase YbeY [Bacteroidota bacterium]|nr:rRNA maturation RNase YbeY [Bacteroidota bacterium]